MEKLKNITIIFLLAVGLFTPVAPAKTTSVLLQEGLYAEEIQGDLDGAIKIYEHVISESKDTQRAAAQATYRIGMCYLKKGEKAKAAEQFQNLILKYPEQQTLVTRAREQLEKLGPAFMDKIGLSKPVPVDELIKSGKVPAFKTQIYDNTGLDLETGVSVPLMNEWPALCDVAWDNDGGGALMIKPSSSVRFLALGAAEKWKEAISMARNSLASLRTSTSKGMFASESKFATVLTTEGNLAIIQIGEYDANKGTIYGWIEKIPAENRGFGPVIERVINDDGEEKNWLIDFDTGRLFSHTTEFNSNEAFLRWIAENRIDAMGETRTSSPGLYGFDMAAIPIAAERWNTISPIELAEDLSIAKAGTPAFMSAMGDLPVAYIFKTREGGMGVVQILEMQDNEKPRHLRIRYKMLQEPPVRGDSAKAMEFLSGLKVLMGGVVGAIESDDPNTALLLLDKLIAQSKQFKPTVKDTSVEASVKAGLEMLDGLRDALEKKQMGRIKSLLAALNQMGPAIESALEKEAEQQGQSKKKTSINEKLRSTFIACKTLCDSIRNALDNDDFESAETICKEVEKHIEKGLELTPQTELGPMLESLADQFKVWHEAIKVKDKKKAIRLGEELDRAGGLISNFVLEEKPDTQK